MATRTMTTTATLITQTKHRQHGQKQRRRTIDTSAEIMSKRTTMTTRVSMATGMAGMGRRTTGEGAWREGRGRMICGYESSGGDSTGVEVGEEEETRRGWRRGRSSEEETEEESESESRSDSESSESGYACSSSSFDSDGGSSFDLEHSLSDPESPDSSGSEDDDQEEDHDRNEEHVGDKESKDGGEGEGGGESGWDEGDMITPKPTDFVPRWFEYRDKGESKGRERVRERRGEREKDKEQTPRAGFIVPKAYSSTPTPTHRSRHKRTHRRSKESNVSLVAHRLPSTSTQLHLPHLPHPILSPLGLTSPCASSIDEYPFPLLPDGDVDNVGSRGSKQVRVERQRQTMGRVELREMMIKIQREMYRAERVRLVEKCLRLSPSVESMDR